MISLDKSEFLGYYIDVIEREGVFLVYYNRQNQERKNNRNEQRQSNTPYKRNH